MKKNNRGFTLIEVLVAITIMGIITVMALPGVQQLQSQNRERKYEKYGESLVDSAKLYVDSNEDDIFGYAKSGCADIGYKELEAKALVKDYAMNDVSCAGNPDNSDISDDTFIHVEKKNGKYVYQPYITCMKNGKIEYQTSTPITTCDNSTAGGSGSITISITTDSQDKWERKKDVTVQISSDAGFVQNTMAFYCIATKDSSGKYKCLEDTRKILDFGNNYGDKTAKVTETISDLTGSYYFMVLGQGTISDLAGNTYSKDAVSSFALKLDNTPPTITNITKAAPLFWGDLLYRLQVEFYDEPAGSKITRVTYTYDKGEEQDEKCSINVAYHGDCTDIKSPYITTAFTVNRNVDVVMKVYDEAGNSASYKTHVD